MASTDVVLSPENKAFTLVARKNIRDNEAKKAAHMANIEKATGVTGWVFDFEGEPAALEKSLEVGGWKDKVGGVLLDSYMKNIAEMITKNCKDSMIKEAFVEAATAKKIVFFLEPSKTTGSQHVSMKDGKLYVGTHETTFNHNMGDIYNFKLETIL